MILECKICTASCEQTLRLLKWVDVEKPHTNPPVYGFEASVSLLRLIGKSCLKNVLTRCYKGTVDTSQRVSKRKFVWVLGLETAIVLFGSVSAIENRKAVSAQLHDWLVNKSYFQAPNGSLLKVRRRDGRLSSHRRLDDAKISKKKRDCSGNRAGCTSLRHFGHGAFGVADFESLGTFTG